MKESGRVKKGERVCVCVCMGERKNGCLVGRERENIYFSVSIRTHPQAKREIL